MKWNVISLWVYFVFPASGRAKNAEERKLPPPPQPRKKRWQRTMPTIFIISASCSGSVNDQVYPQSRRQTIMETPVILEITLCGVKLWYHCSGRSRQRGADDCGLLGFLLPDILNEVKRGKKLHCEHCLKTGATLQCAKCQMRYVATTASTSCFSLFCTRVVMNPALERGAGSGARLGTSVVYGSGSVSYL